MIDSTDMSTPVTRGELKAELEQFEIRLEQRIEQKFDQKLEFWGGALLARIEAGERRMTQRMDVMDQRFDAMERRLGGIEGMEQRLLAELARHTGAIQEWMSKQISIIDEKYADLPSRVTQLEAKVSTRRRR
jgi:hypothetical protein